MSVLDRRRAPAYFRSGITKEAPQRVDRKGRVIRGVSVITRGEALGHELWIDDEFLGEVARLGNLREGGIKSRFTHPGMCSDGTGKVLGRVSEFRVSGGRVLGDLGLLGTASRAPDGDLAGYVLDLAEEAPELFGTSIVFRRDREAEDAYRAEHLDDQGRFVSPDSENAQNLPHARIRLFRAVDVVDDPAANPGGFFSASGEQLEQAHDALAFVLGLSDQDPGEGAFWGVHPDRARQFVGRFFSSRGLALGPKRKEVVPMATTKEAGSVPQGAAPEKVPASLEKLEADYSDPSFVLECLKAGRTVEEAKAAWTKRENEQLRAENDRLKADLGKAENAAKKGELVESLKGGGVEPIVFGGRDEVKGDVVSLARQIRDQGHPQLTAEQRRVGFGMRSAVASSISSNGGLGFRAKRDQIKGA